MTADNSSQNHSGWISKSIPLWSLMPVSSPHSVTECHSEIATGPTMTEEIEGLLSNSMFEMPGKPSMYTFPRRPPLVAPNNPVASRGEVPPIQDRHFQVTWSSHLYPHTSLHRQVWQTSQPILAAPPHAWNMPERDTSPTPFQSQANSINLSDNVLHLQEEMNDAMVHLLTGRASIDNHCWRIISEREVSHCQNKSNLTVSHCQNKSNLTEASREVKARYAIMIGDDKSTYLTAMRKA